MSEHASDRVAKEPAPPSLRPATVTLATGAVLSVLADFTRWVGWSTLADVFSLLGLVVLLIGLVLLIRTRAVSTGATITVAAGVLILVFGRGLFFVGQLVGTVVLVIGLVRAHTTRRGGSHEVREVERRQAAQSQAVERQVEQMAALQAAWERAHPGQPMPAIAAPTVGTDRTNTPALLSLVFGILGTGPVAVVLGHVAKSQIRRTGEQGNGMATAGLVLGYLGLAVSVGVLIYYVAVLASL